MKFLYGLLILILFQSCSFDNKSGIWKNADKRQKKESQKYKDYRNLSQTNDAFRETIQFNNNFKIKLKTPQSNLEWKDIYYNQSNNLNNLKYNNQNEILFKSKKITNNKVNDYIIYEENYIITSDIKGNLIVFSIKDNKEIVKYNFYKKKFKQIEKYLNIIVENNIIYVSDNIGFLYAFDYKQKKILWAKNYKIPFRSNTKIFENRLITSNQNNKLFFFNKKNGDIKKTIPTEETVIKNQFINNLSIRGDSLFFLNTYGSIYSIDIDSTKINWFINLNKSLNINPSNLFYGNKIINNNSQTIVSSNNSTHIINSDTGFVEYTKNFSSHLKPIIHNNILFLVTKKNFLVAVNLKDGKIIYSYDINKEVADFLKTSKNEIQIKNMMLINNNIYLFLKNSYLIKFNIYGVIKEIIKLRDSINSQPILIDNSILYLNKKNKLLILN
jgi:outer membrane protein assembly factor BamB